jgi:outer membrane protein assembly factor BamB
LFVWLFGIHAVLGNADDYDWPRWRGPNGDGISLETDWNPEALSGGPKILWKVDVGVGYSNVAIEDNRLYAIGLKKAKDHILCLNAENGREIWRYSFESRFLEPQSTPIVDGNRVYGLGAEGTLVCLKTKNGKVQWEKDLGHEFDARSTTMGWATSPVVDGKLLLLNANTVEIALKKKNGDLVWSIDDEVPSGSWGSYATTAVYDYNGTRIALFLGPSTLNAVDVTKGIKLWSDMHDEELHPVADPIMFDNKAFISLSRYCFMQELTEIEPRELWNNTELTGWLSPAVLVDGFLYGTHKPSEGYYVVVGDWSKMLRLDWPMRCIDVKTGAVMWEKSMKHVSLIAANGKLIMLGKDGTLRIAEATSSSDKELYSADVLGGEKRPRIFATPPVLCNGKIYCRNRAGDLVCIDVSK